MQDYGAMTRQLMAAGGAQPVNYGPRDPWTGAPTTPAGPDSIAHILMMNGLSIEDVIRALKNVGHK